MQSSNLSQVAIDAALSSRWNEALRINKKIIKLEPQNVDALVRLARAYMELGRFNLCKRYYSEALKFDPYNPIATKNLKIVKSFKHNGKPPQNDGQIKISASLFLREPGKTKVVGLLKVAEPQKLSQAFCGMKVDMVIKGRKVIVADISGAYLGVLPDDVCHHMLRLLRGGNKYDLFIKSVRVNGVSVLIKETFRSKRFRNQPSFLDGTFGKSSSDLLTSLEGDDGGEEEYEEATEETV